MPPSSKKKDKPVRPLKEEVIEVLKNTYDPELGIDIHTLGFVRNLRVDPDKETALIEMTLTSPLCPYGPQMLKEVEDRLRRLGLKQVKIEFVFDPPWQPSAEVRLMLGL